MTLLTKFCKWYSYLAIYFLICSMWSSFPCARLQVGSYHRNQGELVFVTACLVFEGSILPMYWSTYPFLRMPSSSCHILHTNLGSPAYNMQGCREGDKYWPQTLETYFWIPVNGWRTIMSHLSNGALIKPNGAAQCGTEAIGLSDDAWIHSFWSSPTYKYSYKLV